ncbi:MAG: hypothetical protein U1E42_15705 [Rhodospirillales bacterium]
MREIVPDIFVWSWHSERHGYDFNGHLIRYPGGNICVDPVQPGDAILDQIIAFGAARIVLTNRNHSRAAGLLRAKLGARTVVHPDEAAHVREQGIEVDDFMRPGDEIGPFTVVGAAGKSAGEIALHWSARRILLVGDAVIGDPPGHCKLLPDKVVDDPARLRHSVRELLELEFDILLLGDGVSLLSDAKDRLRELTDRLAD